MLHRAAQHRANPWHLQICVRRDGELIGLLDGNANLTERSVRMLHAMSGEQESGEGGSMRRRPPRWITGLARRATGWRLGARVDEAFERRIARWAQLAPPSRYAGMHRFHISTVAIDPDERGRGHLHAMLGRVSAYCARYLAIERVTVGTAHTPPSRPSATSGQASRSTSGWRMRRTIGRACGGSVCRRGPCGTRRNSRVRREAGPFSRSTRSAGTRSAPSARASGCRPRPTPRSSARR